MILNRECPNLECIAIDRSDDTVWNIESLTIMKGSLVGAVLVKGSQTKELSGDALEAFDFKDSTGRVDDFGETIYDGDMVEGIFLDMVNGICTETQHMGMVCWVNGAYCYEVDDMTGSYQENCVPLVDFVEMRVISHWWNPNNPEWLDYISHNSINSGLDDYDFLGDSYYE